MPRDTSTMTRREVEDRYEDNSEKLREKRDVLDKTASDVATIRDLREGLDLRGTSEGADAVEEGVDGAEDATEEVFDREDEKLEQLQEESTEHGTDLKDRADSDESDLSKIQEARDHVDTQEALGDLLDASEKTAEDRDFLRGMEERTEKARDTSEQARQEYRAIVKGGSRR